MDSVVMSQVFFHLVFECITKTICQKDACSFCMHFPVEVV